MRMAHARAERRVTLYSGDMGNTFAPSRESKVPWKECHKMEERARFVTRLLDGEKMAVLCREFGISRKTGYKIFNRYKDCGLEGLTDRSSRTRPAKRSITKPDGNS
jgi:hypothetical protein